MCDLIQMCLSISICIWICNGSAVKQTQHKVLKISGSKGQTRGIIGEEFRIQCVNSGPTTTMTWLRNNNIIARVRVEGCNLSSVGLSPKYRYKCDANQTFYLIIPGENMTDEEDNTTWSCQNTEFKVGSFLLNVDVPVKSVSMFLYQDVDKRKLIKFGCMTSASRPEAKIKWYLKINPNTTEKTKSRSKHKRFRTTSTISLQKTDNVVGESVYCTAHSSDTGDTVESNHYIIPAIGNDAEIKYDVLNDNQIILNNSDSVIFICNGGLSNIIDTNIIHIGHKSQEDFEIGSFKTLKYNETLIQNVSCMDTGKYKCESMHTGNDSYSANLFVRCKPKVLNKSRTTISVLAGDTFNASVHFFAYPPATLNWTFKKSTEDTVIDIKYISGFNVIRYNLTRFMEVSILQKYNISIDNFGEYTVNLENNLGFTTETFKVLNEEYGINSDSSSEGKIIILPIILSIIFAIVVLAVIVKIKQRAVIKNNTMADRESCSSREGFDGRYFFSDVLHEQLQSNQNSYENVSSEEDMELDLFLMLDVPPYENQCIARELEAESQYDDLEPDNPAQTSMEWPYEEVDRSVDDPRENISLTEENNDSRDLRSAETEDRYYNNVFMSNYYENYNEKLPPARLRANPPRDTVSTSSYENCRHMNP